MGRSRSYKSVKISSSNQPPEVATINTPPVLSVYRPKAHGFSKSVAQDRPIPHISNVRNGNLKGKSFVPFLFRRQPVMYGFGHVFSPHVINSQVLHPPRQYYGINQKIAKKPVLYRPTPKTYPVTSKNYRVIPKNYPVTPKNYPVTPKHYPVTSKKYPATPKTVTPNPEPEYIRKETPKPVVYPTVRSVKKMNNVKPRLYESMINAKQPQTMNLPLAEDGAAIY